MQILPSSSSQSDSFFLPLNAGADNAAPDATFGDSMQAALQEMEDGQGHTASTPLVEAPYSRHSSNGVIYTLDEVCFSKQELEDLRQQLLKAGAPQQSLRQFDLLVDQPDGATIGQVMLSLLGNKGDAQLDDKELEQLTNLLKKIDPSGKLGESVFMLLDEGKGQEALESIYASLAGLEAGSTVDITREEILALGKALNLNTATVENIAATFGDAPALSIYSGQFAQLMAPATEELASGKANRDKLAAALEETLQPIIRKARDRMEAAEEATSLQSRKVEQSRVMITRTVLEDSRATLDNTLNNGQQTELPSRQESAQAGLVDALRQAAPDMGHKADAEPDLHQGNDARQGRKQGRSQGWEELLGKVEYRGEARPAASGSGNSALYAMLQAQPAAEAMPQAETAIPAPISRHVAQQVEQGVLTSLKGGGNRLELQLHPMELGAITITLTARNGEVSARLVADKSETAEMLAHQVESIRINLEQQGIKVDKVEVQLQNHGSEEQTAWQNLDQHNSWQEQEARREEFARLRNLATIRNNRENDEISTLEHSLQSMTQTARYANQRLHVVA